MSDAKTLLKEFLGNIGNPEKAAALFAEDGVFEMPFFVSLGLPTRFNGLWASRASSPPSWTTTPTSSSTTRTSPSSSTPPIRCSPNTSLTPQPQRQVGGPTTYPWATSSLRERPDHAAARGPKHRRSGLRAAPRRLR